MTGKFIVIEGSDGSGKSTQIELLDQYLKDKNITHKIIDFPRYQDNLYGSFIRKYLAGEFGEATAVNPYLISLAYGLDRMLAKETLQDWLKNGEIVIANRYMQSNLAHQGAKLSGKQREDFINWLLQAEFEVNQIPKEDLLLFLYVPVEVSQRLMAERGQAKDQHELNVDYLREVEKVYLALADRFDHWVRLDGVLDGQLRSKEDISGEIIKILKEKQII